MTEEPTTTQADDEESAGLTTADLAGRGAEPETDADSADTASASEEARPVPLFSGDESQHLRDRWTDIQAGFVDQPREMVEQADGLVADLMQRLAAQFSDERSRLESQWGTEDDVSTEDLRVALTRYRSFFERLLNA
jgi:hypothetical protein